ncbi:hypothetical protein B0H16DRAFT_1472793 [Mycena metata]|uniref:Uncharacterized protein n=1 Tax=Mycena metata TaxID=1033252 RepID=A0AAD7MMG4_9AGAR|nr:hypothetical protein B0H16DRAFT_1472793 [Mycena metata]
MGLLGAWRKYKYTLVSLSANWIFKGGSELKFLQIVPTSGTWASWLMCSRLLQRRKSILEGGKCDCSGSTLVRFWIFEAQNWRKNWIFEGRISGFGRTTLGRSFTGPVGIQGAGHRGISYAVQESSRTCLVTLRVVCLFDIVNLIFSPAAASARNRAIVASVGMSEWAREKLTCNVNPSSGRDRKCTPDQLPQREVVTYVKGPREAPAKGCPPKMPDSSLKNPIFWPDIGLKNPNSDKGYHVDG